MILSLNYFNQLFLFREDLRVYSWSYITFQKAVADNYHDNEDQYWQVPEENLRGQIVSQCICVWEYIQACLGGERVFMQIHFET